MMGLLVYDKFWLIGLASVMAAIALFYFVLTSLVVRGELTKAEAVQLAGAGALLLGAPALIVRAAAAATGHQIAICGVQLLRSTPGIIILVAQAGSWATLLWWVWLSNGAGIIARALPISWNRIGVNYNAERTDTRVVVTVRIAITMLVFIGLASSIAANPFSLIPVCTRANEIQSALFGKPTSLGLVRLREYTQAATIHLPSGHLNDFISDLRITLES